MGLQALKPSIREKKRYICFKSQFTTQKDAENAILSRIKTWIGEKNYSLGRVHFMSKLYQGNKGIISCNHKEYLDIKTGITLTKDVEVFYVSGSLKKAKEKLQEEL